MSLSVVLPANAEVLAEPMVPLSLAPGRTAEPASAYRAEDYTPDCLRDIEPDYL